MPLATHPQLAADRPHSLQHERWQWHSRIGTWQFVQQVMMRDERRLPAAPASCPWPPPRWALRGRDRRSVMADSERGVRAPAREAMTSSRTLLLLKSLNVPCVALLRRGLAIRRRAREILPLIPSATASHIRMEAATGHRHLSTSVATHSSARHQGLPCVLRRTSRNMPCKPSKRGLPLTARAIKRRAHRTTSGKIHVNGEGATLRLLLAKYSRCIVCAVVRDARLE